MAPFDKTAKPKPLLSFATTLPFCLPTADSQNVVHPLCMGQAASSAQCTRAERIQSDTPRRAGGLMSWAASKAVGRGSRRRALRASLETLELSVTIRGILLADVLADLLQLEPYRGHSVAACPEVFSGEIPLLAGKPGNGNRTLAFQETDHGGDRVFGRDRDAHVHVVWHQVSFHDLALLLLCQRVEHWTQLTPDIPKDGFPPSFGYENNVVLAVPLGVG
jgi:hypothetical protein